MSTELRYGTKFASPPLARAAMTDPSVESDLLMFAASFNRLPVAPVSPARSLPARSTRLILLTCRDKEA